MFFKRLNTELQTNRVLIRQNVHKYLYTCLKLLTREPSYNCLSLHAVRPFAAFAGIKGLTLISCRPSLLAGCMCLIQCKTFFTLSSKKTHCSKHEEKVHFYTSLVIINRTVHLMTTDSKTFENGNNETMLFIGL